MHRAITLRAAARSRGRLCVRSRETSAREVVGARAPDRVSLRRVWRGSARLGGRRLSSLSEAGSGIWSTGAAQGTAAVARTACRQECCPGCSPLLTIAPPPCRPFRQWYEAHYGVKIGLKKRGKKKDGDDADVKKSSRVLRKLASRQKDRVLDATLDDQFASGRLLACISSRPGQSGRADGYILEGSELAFYKKKLDVKKDKKH